MSRGTGRAQVVIAHTIPDRAPIRIEPGQRVEVGERDTEWPAFVMVTTPSGTGWVPARHLSSTTGTATVQVGYDTTELPTTVGEQLEAVERDTASGWTWCRNADGREGWVPDRTLDLP